MKKVHCKSTDKDSRQLVAVLLLGGIIMMMMMGWLVEKRAKRCVRGMKPSFFEQSS